MAMSHLSRRTRHLCNRRKLMPRRTPQLCSSRKMSCRTPHLCLRRKMSCRTLQLCNNRKMSQMSRRTPQLSHLCSSRKMSHRTPQLSHQCYRRKMSYQMALPPFGDSCRPNPMHVRGLAVAMYAMGNQDHKDEQAHHSGAGSKRSPRGGRTAGGYRPSGVSGVPRGGRGAVPGVSPPSKPFQATGPTASLFAVQFYVVPLSFMEFGGFSCKLGS